MILFDLSRFIRKVLLASLVDKKLGTNLLLFNDGYGDYAIDSDCKLDYVLTLGVGNNVNFEKWLLTINPNIEFTLVDPIIEVELSRSIKIEKLVAREGEGHLKFARRKLDDNSFFYYPDVHGSFSSIGLKECLTGDERNILLKFDIEGYEFVILPDLIQFLERYPINQIVCELHWNWYDIRSLLNVLDMFKELRGIGFYPVWKSGLCKEFLLTKFA